MKQILHSLPLMILASAAAAHDSPHTHHHITDANWMALAAGLLVIGAAAFFAWTRK